MGNRPDLEATPGAQQAPRRHKEPDVAGAAGRNSGPFIETVDLHKVYRTGPSEVHALRGINLVVEAGDYVAVMGPSGSGKSTLLHILGCLDRPTQGKYFLEGLDVSTLGPAELAALRNRRIGFVFQSFNLLPRETALENVTLPLVYAGARNLRRRGLAALEAVGLGHRWRHYPGQLSGGEQQRVAIARALVKEPSLLLADEPTGNLDSQTAQQILELFDRLHAGGLTLVVITHNPEVALRARRILRLKDGLLVGDERIYGGQPSSEAGADTCPVGTARGPDGVPEVS
jgi:putative ABC transport system ATP-binding protein